ncbi:hypothetical protein LPJ64_000167 [Coemansia asiatica]|uniref:Uncharacterized protein n=1 Tax=Coemansia asiatica TaxID=1052880 RepID=A0A9W7XSH3_9FUNG|nr:hypothetical protein LPJ64_000167 [Coemansia asiatica]
MFLLCNGASTATLTDVTTATTTVTLNYIETVTVTLSGQKSGRDHHGYFVRDSGQQSNGNNDSDSDSGIQINQIDLLSGVPTLLLIVVGIVQLWPSSSNVCQGHIREFLNWLKTNIESDFSVTLFCCNGTCHTSSFDFSNKMLKRRINADIGSSHIAHCTGDGHISVEEFIAVIQDKDNSSIMMELARLARYPKMKDLSMAIRILKFSSTFSNQVIFLQWLNLAAVYVFNWILRDRLPNLLYQVFLFVTNIFRILFRAVPVEYSPHKSPYLRHDMAELAMHHVVNEHVPWIRYSIYYMLISLSGRQLTIDASIGNDSIAEDDLNELEQASSLHTIENQNALDIKHPMASERSLAIRMTSDQCSAARFLYSTALHSLRINLICSHIGYPPSNVLVGSFRLVRTNTQRAQFIFKHDSLNMIFKDLYRYRWAKRPNKAPAVEKKYHSYRIYKSLLRMLRSSLGNAITEQYSVQALADLTLYIFPSEYVDALKSPSGNNVNWDKLKIEGFDVETDLIKKLVWGHYKTCESLIDFLHVYLTSRIHWGASMWLLYSLYDFWCQYLRQTVSDVDSLHDNMWIIFMHLNKVIFAPYKVRQKNMPDEGDSGNEFDIIPTFSDNGNNNDKDNGKDNDDDSDDNEKVSSSYSWKSNAIVFRDDLVAFDFELEINHAAYRNSVPAWCLCTDRCRGICTLIVENCGMRVSNDYYFYAPYTFSKNKDLEEDSILDNPCALVCLANQRMLLEFASLGTYFRRYEHRDISGQHVFKPGFLETNGAFSRLLDIANPDIYFNNRRHKRIDEAEYLLSRLLYENADQMVVIFNSHIYTVGLQRDRSKLKWRNHRKSDEMGYWVAYYDVAMINKTTCLDLNHVPYIHSSVTGISNVMLKSLMHDQLSEIRSIAEDRLLAECANLQTIYV